MVMQISLRQLNGEVMILKASLEMTGRELKRRSKNVSGGRTNSQVKQLESRFLLERAS